jgi:hypothetical protein
MNSLRSILLLASASMPFELLFSNRHLLTGVLEAADEILTINDHVAHGAKILIAYARAALVVQEME